MDRRFKQSTNGEETKSAVAQAGHSPRPVVPRESSPCYPLVPQRGTPRPSVPSICRISDSALIAHPIRVLAWPVRPVTPVRQRRPAGTTTQPASSVKFETLWEDALRRRGFHRLSPAVCYGAARNPPPRGRGRGWWRVCLSSGLCCHICSTAVSLPTPLCALLNRDKAPHTSSSP